MSRPQSTTPSGVPQNEPKSVVVPRLPNSIRCTEKSNHPKPRCTSHDLAHSTGLLKLPGYNLEWPRVTPIQVTLVISPSEKASHHDLHPKQCRNPPLNPTIHPKPSGTQSHVVWCLLVLLPHQFHLTELTVPPSATHVQWPLPLFYSRVHFVAYLLAVYIIPLDAAPLTSNLLVFDTLE